MPNPQVYHEMVYACPWHVLFRYLQIGIWATDHLINNGSMLHGRSRLSLASMCFSAFSHTHISLSLYLFVCSASDCRRFGRIWMLRANTSHGSIIYDYYFLTSSIKLNSLDNKNGNYLFNFHQRKISIDSRMAFWRILRIQSIGLLLITQHNYYVKMMRWLYWWYRYCVASCYRLSNVVPVGDCERQLIERKW